MFPLPDRSDIFSNRSALVTAITLALSTIVFLFRYISIRERQIALPGPKGLPCFGVAFQFRTGFQWQQIEQWHKKYGPLIALKVFGHKLVSIGSEEIASELLRTRGNIYSDRHYIAVLRGQIHLPTVGYGDIWRRQRKFFHQSQLCCTLSAQTGSIYEQVINDEVTNLVQNLEAHPEDWNRIVEAYICAIAVRLAYGRKVDNYNDPYVQQIIDQYNNFERAARPDFYLVNAFPILRHIPAWLAPFKNSGKEYLDEEREYLRSTLNEVRSGMKLTEESAKIPKTGWSLAKQYWQNKEKRDEDGLSTEEAAYTLGGFVSASMAGTPPTLKAFFLAMLHYHEWQRKLQEEVKAVIKESGSWPCWTHKDKLPVTRAVIKEVLRWRPIPTGFPHTLSEDDI